MPLTGLPLRTVHGFLDHCMEGRVELLEHLVPLQLSASDLVEFLFHRGGEPVVHDAVEVLDEEVGDDDPDVGREQFRLLTGIRFLANGFRHRIAHE